MAKNKGNEEQKDMCRRWFLDYLLWFFLGIMIVCVIMLLGYQWLSKRIWYYNDTWYPFLHNVHTYWIDYVIGIALALNLFLVYRLFYKISMGIRNVSAAVSAIEDDKNEEIELQQFPYIQNQINAIRLKLRVNKQEAEESTKRKNDMIMYMAHDLKTPLTSVIGYLTLVTDEQELPVATRQKYEEIALKKALRLEDLINEFFEVTKLNFARMVLETQQVNMSVMVEQILLEFEPIFAANGITYTLEKEDNLMLLCDVNKMERVFDNLLRNIANYSYENSQVEISLERYGEKGIMLKTKNHGKTIPKEMQEAIFDQFFRMDRARGTDTGASGLGLAVTKEIVNLHGGQIHCESDNEIICFVLTIP